MYKIFTASKDTYITNKILRNTSRATDANLGAASTLDLFKLYDESVISGETTPIELSRALIKFNTTDISSSLEGKVSFDHSSFKCHLKLSDLQGGSIAPEDFNLVVYPLSQSFDEGLGADVSNLGFLDRANWITASFTNNTNVLWKTTGARSVGLLGSSDIDIIDSGSIGGSVVQLYRSQYFEKGTEDLFVDITTPLSAAMCGIIPSHGFLIAYSGYEETDAKSRFVKRFASRHVKNQYIRPKIIVSYDDTIVDNHKDSEFNLTGSLFLKTFQRGSPANLVSGSAASEIGGNNCILVKLYTGSFTKYFTGSSYSKAGITQTGLYSANVVIDGFDTSVVNGSTTIANHVAASGSITFREEWLSLDENVSFFSGSIKFLDSFSTIGNQKRDFLIKLSNIKNSYAKTDTPSLRLFITDLAERRKPTRKPLKASSITLNKVYYRIVDADNGIILVPFDKVRDTTRVSRDESGMYFSPSFSSLIKGRNYHLQFLIIDRGEEFIVSPKARFRIK